MFTPVYSSFYGVENLFTCNSWSQQLSFLLEIIQNVVTQPDLLHAMEQNQAIPILANNRWMRVALYKALYCLERTHLIDRFSIQKLLIPSFCVHFSAFDSFCSKEPGLIFFVWLPGPLNVYWMTPTIFWVINWTSKSTVLIRGQVHRVSPWDARWPDYFQDHRVIGFIFCQSLLFGIYVAWCSVRHS